MSLKHALLGFLVYGDRTGYELGRMFDYSVTHFWPTNLSQIYPTLQEMADEGLVTFRRVEQEKRPFRKVFSLTEAGRTELERWLREPLTLMPERDHFLVQLWFSADIDKADTIECIRAYAEQVSERLTWYKTEAKARIKLGLERYGRPMDKLYWNMTIDYCIKQYELWLEWAQDAMQLIAGFEFDDAEAKATKI